MINVNGNRVGTEQIERCLWGVRVGGWRVRDCAVVGAPDFVKGDAPVAFVAFRDGSADARPGATKNQKPKSAAFRSRRRRTPSTRRRSRRRGGGGQELGAYAAPDHVFVVDALPKTITNKTSRKALQLLLAGEPASDASLAGATRSPIAAMVREWHKTGATTSAAGPRDVLGPVHVFAPRRAGPAIVPGAGWLCMLAAETDARKLADVAFMRGVHAADADVRVTKRRKALQATVGNQVVLRAVVAAGAAAPVGVGPTTFGGAADVAGAVGSSPPDADASARVSKRKRPSPPATEAKKPKPDDAAREKKEAAAGVVVTEEATAAQHYRRCGALRLEYSGAYRAVAGVEWSGHVFRAEVKGTHLAAVLDAGLQVACAAVRAATFIPVAVKDLFCTSPRRPGTGPPARRTRASCTARSSSSTPTSSWRTCGTSASRRFRRNRREERRFENARHGDVRGDGTRALRARRGREAPATARRAGRRTSRRSTAARRRLTPRRRSCVCGSSRRSSAWRLCARWCARRCWT